MLTIRPYRPADWPRLQQIHDPARRNELALAGMPDAFRPLAEAAEEEGLFDYPHLDVAEVDGTAAGFAAYTDEELGWVYVDPAFSRKGIGRALLRHALEAEPDLYYIEVLAGNIPGRTGTISQKIAMVIQDGDYLTAGIWVGIVMIIAFLIIFLMNLISGKKMKHIGRW